MENREFLKERKKLEYKIQTLLNDYTQKYKLACNCKVHRLFELDGTNVPVDYNVKVILEI